MTVFTALQKLKTNIFGGPGNTGFTKPPASRVQDINLQPSPTGLLSDDPLSYATFSYPLDVQNNFQNGHYILFYVNVQNKTKYKYQSQKGVDIGDYELTLGTGAKTVLTWDWTPDSSGVKEISIHTDSNDVLDEMDEINNVYYDSIQVTTPGINLNSGMSVIEWTNSNSDSARWSVNITNTAFIETNTTIRANNPIQRSTLLSKQWTVSFSKTNHNLEGQETKEILISLSIPEIEFPPEPGYYDIELI